MKKQRRHSRRRLNTAIIHVAVRPSSLPSQTNTIVSSHSTIEERSKCTSEIDILN